MLSEKERRRFALKAEMESTVQKKEESVSPDPDVATRPTNAKDAAVNETDGRGSTLTRRHRSVPAAFEGTQK